MDEKVKGFEGWAIVELFGHSQIAGMCSEQPMAGTSMLRVDVPGQDGQKGFTKFYGGAAIYAITPTDEETARLALKHIMPRPVQTWTVPDRVVKIPEGGMPEDGYPITDADFPDDED